MIKSKNIVVDKPTEKKENQKFLSELGKRVYEIRIKKGITQTELADKINRDRQIIQRLEKGKTNCSVNLLRIVAKALEVHPNKLFEF